ncbi:MAG: hypothetical protein MUQ10_18995 [Anaerolineae bacterium]|nr:hypothetical protein [Anaerolineae bacterium]
MDEFNRKTMEELDRILASDETELAKLVQTFDWTTRRMIAAAQGEIELAQAMHDREALIKHQIKTSTLRLARDVFQNCYLRVTGKRTRLWEA